MKLQLRQGEMMRQQDKKKKEGKEKLGTPKKNLSISNGLSLSLPSGRHSSKSVFPTRKFTSSHMQMKQVHRLFNKHIWRTSIGKPHKFHRYQVQKPGLKFTFVVPY